MRVRTKIFPFDIIRSRTLNDFPLAYLVFRIFFRCPLDLIVEFFLFNQNLIDQGSRLKNNYCVANVTVRFLLIFSKEKKIIFKFSYRRAEPMSEADLDGEEEFYYTEIEVPLNGALAGGVTASAASVVAATALADSIRICNGGAHYPISPSSSPASSLACTAAL